MVYLLWVSLALVIVGTIRQVTAIRSDLICRRNSEYLFKRLQSGIK